MADEEFGKRDFLRLAGGLAVGSIAGARAIAQDGQLFGLPVPKEILDIIPRTPMNYVRVADAVLRMEREADHKQIPDSILSRHKGQPITALDDTLYQLALPRLVALIDRTETIDVGLADKAGELLAEIHQTQHELPEALRLAPPGFQTLATSSTNAQFMVPTAGDVAQRVEVLPVPDILPPAVKSEPETAPESSPPAATPTPPPDDEPDKPLSKSKNFEVLKGELGRMFRKLEVRPEHEEAADWHLAMMQKSRSRYESVGEQTGVPWHFIAAIHGLESSFNFRAHLHNGDFPLSSRTRQVPAGRPTKWLPPSDWESSAKDALRILGFTGQQDWSLERTLYRLEAFNGFGYRSYGVPTPYLWSFSQFYDRGKFVSDGKFSQTARSQQCGTAVMLKLLENAGDVKLGASE